MTKEQDLVKYAGIINGQSEIPRRQETIDILFSRKQ